MIFQYIKKTIPILLLLAPLACADKTASNDYKTDPAFMELYDDFLNKTDGIGIVTANEVVKDDEGGHLVLVLESDVYVYDTNRNLVKKTTLRSAPNSGFHEITAVSHIGPALAYILVLKKRNNPEWKSLMERLLLSVKKVQSINAKTDNNWLEKLDKNAWKPHGSQIRNMIDYGCRLSINFMEEVLTNKLKFDDKSIDKYYYQSSTKTFPIGFNNVMVGTFMLAGIDGLYNLYETLNPVGIDWKKAKVILRLVAGTNDTGGLSKETNWLFYAFKKLSNDKLGDERIMFPAYSDIKKTVGQKVLSKEDFNYYSEVWSEPFDRFTVVKSVFEHIPSIKENFRRHHIPGDYEVTKANDIDGFIQRMKYSFGDPTQILSNTIGFWLPGELKRKNWNFEKIDIPGLTTGFPKGIKNYPTTP